MKIQSGGGVAAKEQLSNSTFQKLHVFIFVPNECSQMNIIPEFLNRDWEGLHRTIDFQLG